MTPSGIASCVGSTANGATIDTQTVGDFVFTVTAKDVAGNTLVETRNYKVKPVEGDVGGGAPATLNLTLGQPTAFAPFMPGVGRDYTTTLVATILSTAADATLSVADASSTATGHLVNGAFALEKAVVAGATSTVEYAHSSTPGPVGGSANPTMLLTYDGPVTNDTPTLTFTQAHHADRGAAYRRRTRRRSPSRSRRPTRDPCGHGREPRPCPAR